MAKVKSDLSSDQMLTIALKAMTEIGHEYSKEWTNTWLPPWWAHEVIYTTAIGRALQAEVLGCVLYEYGVRKMVKSARGLDKSKPIDQAFSSRLRTDVAVFRSSDAKPLFCIEVKNNGLNKKGALCEDIKRCEQVVKLSGKGALNAAVVFLLPQGGEKENLKTAFTNGWAGRKVVGLDENKTLTRSYSPRNVQEYAYNGQPGYEKERPKPHRPKDGWAAVAVCIS